jgi:hypothetical protein
MMMFVHTNQFGKECSTQSFSGPITPKAHSTLITAKLGQCFIEGVLNQLLITHQENTNAT